MEVGRERAKERPSLVGEGGGQPGGGVERLGQLEELAGLQAPAARAALDRGPDVARGADPDARAVGEERAHLVGLVEPALDDHRVRGRLEGLGEAPRRRERGRRRQPLPDERELEQRDRSLVHGGQRRTGGPETEGSPAMANRHGSSAHGRPA